jgi:type III secretory pathway component EscU
MNKEKLLEDLLDTEAAMDAALRKALVMAVVHGFMFAVFAVWVNGWFWLIVAAVVGFYFRERRFYKEMRLKNRRLVEMWMAAEE